MSTLLHPDDISRFITGRLTGSLASGLVLWQGNIPGLPEHALTGAPFTGINVLLLWQAMQQRSLRSGRWLTGMTSDSLADRSGQVKNPSPWYVTDRRYHCLRWSILNNATDCRTPCSRHGRCHPGHSLHWMSPTVCSRTVGSP